MLHGMEVRLRLEDGKEPLQPATMEGDRRLAFDAYCLDLANEQLLCGDEVVALTPKAFAVPRRLNGPMSAPRMMSIAIDLPALTRIAKRPGSHRWSTSPSRIPVQCQASTLTLPRGRATHIRI